MDCDHIYGYSLAGGFLFGDTDYPKEDKHITKFTYCPYCRVQLHTLDGTPLGLPKDDCMKGGCED